MRNGDTLSLTHQLLFVDVPANTTRPIRLTNTAEPLAHKLWRCTAYIEAPDDVLSDISCVEYTLHSQIRFKRSAQEERQSSPSRLWRLGGVSLT
jgi:hypothetical protein